MTPPSRAQATVIFALLAAAVSLTACKPVQTYDGPRRPASETAKLIPNPTDAGIMFKVLRVDDRSFQIVNDEMALLPGEHTLSLRLTPTSTYEQMLTDPGLPSARDNYFDLHHTAYTSLSFNAQAGHTYKLRGSYAQNHFTATVVDMGDDTVVATTDARVGDVLEESSTSLQDNVYQPTRRSP